MVTIDDIKEYQPDILDFGIQDFGVYFDKTQQDIYRLLEIEWFHVHNHELKMDTAKLDDTQFTRAAVFHVLAYYILPSLTRFDPDGDRFNNMMNFYKQRFREEFDLILKFGVKYDDDSDGTYSETEQAPTNYGRLIR